MPAPDITENFIRLRQKEPNLFVEGSFRTIFISKPQGIKAVIGRLKSEPNSSNVVQSYSFDKDKWNIEETQKWVDEHKKMTDTLLGDNEIIDFSEEEGIKTMQTKISKYYSTEVKDFNDEEMSFTATASTEDVDRDGDMILTNGWKLKNYKKNPVVLWGHDASLMPIGKAKDVRVEDGKLKFTPMFAPKEVNPFAEQVYNAYKQGFLTSFSVRFDPIKWEDITQEDAKVGGGNINRIGRKFTSQELLEISAVNIPANPKATKSPDMVDFIYKSYMYENFNKEYGNLNLNIFDMYEKFNDQIKAKINKMNELMKQKESISETKKLSEIEKQIDSKIVELENEINSELVSSKLEKELIELRSGITALKNK